MQRRSIGTALSAVVILASGIILGVPNSSGVAVAASKAAAPHGGRSDATFKCVYNPTTNLFHGAYGTASELGWEGNHNGVATCLGGNFFIQNSLDISEGFGIYTGDRTLWTDATGFLPEQVTGFTTKAGLEVHITEFCDKVTIAGNAYVLLYAEVTEVNFEGPSTLTGNPEPSPGLVSLTTTPNKFSSSTPVQRHDYVIATDRFGNSYPWPTAAQMKAAGSAASHEKHMKAFWESQVSKIARVTTPYPSQNAAYLAGFIYTQIARSGNKLDTGVTGYEMPFSHDVIGILANLFTQGYFSNAATLLMTARSVVGTRTTPTQYVDGEWTYSWPWAIYLMKTGNLALVKANFSTNGPKGTTEPSLKTAAHQIAVDRTGPGGIMGESNDIDANGLWTIDDFEALMGLAAYRYLAKRVGTTTELAWATGEYNSLLKATNTTLEATIKKYHLDYLPCSIVEPNTANRCSNPEDANWAGSFSSGRWAWDGSLFGAKITGPGKDLIDSTYRYGFKRLKGKLPKGTFGGFPGAYYSTAYNAGLGSWGLVGKDYRDVGILAYEFMVKNTQSGPYSWWESDTAPTPQDPWVGSHPAKGQGASPHGWGMANANKVLLDSIAAQESDGSLVVGRGVPTPWLATGKPISVTNFPTTNGKHTNVRMTESGTSVELTLNGDATTGPVLFELPCFVGNLRATTVGTMTSRTGTVTLPVGTHAVRVTLFRSIGNGLTMTNGSSGTISEILIVILVIVVVVGFFAGFVLERRRRAA